MSVDHTPPLLAREEIVAFYRLGYGTVTDLTTAADLEDVRALLDGLFARFDELPKDLVFDLGDQKLHSGVQRIPQVNVPTRFAPRLKDTLTYHSALAVARQLLGPDADYAYDHSIYKPPHNERATPWHQDLAYGGSGDPHRMSCNVAFWIPLQDATVASGCMQFIPYSHWGALLPHHPVGHDPKVHTLETDVVDPTLAVPCPVRAGSCTLHLPKTLHYTGPNQTDAPRRAWVLNFRVPIPQNQPKA